MKTKIFKTCMPLMAFLMAVSFAFAHQDSTEGNSLVQEYRWDGSECRTVTVGCNNIPTNLCTLGGQIYAKSGTQNCGVMLFHTINP